MTSFSEKKCGAFIKAGAFIRINMVSEKVKVEAQETLDFVGWPPLMVSTVDISCGPSAVKLEVLSQFMQMCRLT